MTIAAGGDLLSCECYAFADNISGHMRWEILKSRLSDLRARRIIVTHMNTTMLSRIDEIVASDVLVAQNGLANRVLVAI